MSHNNKVSYIPTLDGVRAIAIFLVLIGHFPSIKEQYFGDQIANIIGRSQFAYFGVDVFFVLSGFLITRILLAERGRGGIRYRRFYFRRSLRIFPIFYLVVIVCAIFFWGEEIPWVATYLSNYYFPTQGGFSPLRHTWSLAVEEQFYLFWPFLVGFVPHDKLAKVVGLIVPALSILSAVLVLLIYEEVKAGAIIYSITPTRMLSLSLGAYFAINEAEGRLWNYRVIALMGLVGLSLGFLPGLLQVIGVEVPWNRLWKMIGFSMLGGAFVLFVVQTKNSKNLLNKFLLLKPVQYMGRISYGVYLYHLVFLYAVGASHLQPESRWHPLSAIALIGCTVVIAAFSFRFIESPILRMKERVI